MTLRPGLCAAAFLLGGTLCAQDTRDSASIHITMNTKPLWTTSNAWTIAATPTLDIGRADGTPQYEFQNVMGAARLSNGTIVVADMGSSQLRFFDATGRFVRAAGQKGDGPAEFKQLMGVRLVAGDTIIGMNLFDGWETFTAAGAHVRSVRPGPDRLFIQLWFSDGTGIAQGKRSERPPLGTTGNWFDSAAFLRVDRNNVPMNALITFPLMEYGGTGRQQLDVTFSPRSSVTTDGRRLFMGLGAEYSIHVLTPTGTFERIIRRTWTPAPISAKDHDAFVEDYTNPNRESIEPGMNVSSIRALRLRNMEKMVFAPNLPAFNELIADRSGNLWVREPQIADYFVSGGGGRVLDTPTNWSVFDPSGRWLGDVKMPVRFRAFTIENDAVIGLSRDEDDVEHVRSYRIVKPATR